MLGEGMSCQLSMIAQARRGGLNTEFAVSTRPSTGQSASAPRIDQNGMSSSPGPPAACP